MNKQEITFENYAIFATGGKQYQAIPSKTIAVELLEGEAGSEVSFDQVLLVKKGEGNIEIGTPFVSGATVKARIVKHMQGPKLTVFKFKRRKKHRTKRGHRQPMTVVRIESI